MFLHSHPYQIFIPDGCEKLIVGTLPPPRLSTKDLRPKDVDFCYGSCDNQLWPALEKIFQLHFLYDNSIEAVNQRKDFLRSINTGICDIVESCRRVKINAQDLGMDRVILRDIFKQLKLHPTISLLVFTGGNSKNGPEYLFRRQAKEYGVRLEKIDGKHPKEHRFVYQRRMIKTVSLTSPSNAANRAIGSTKLYKDKKRENPEYTPFDYRVEQYSKIFCRQ